MQIDSPSVLPSFSVLNVHLFSLDEGKARQSSSPSSSSSSSSSPDNKAKQNPIHLICLGSTSFIKHRAVEAAFACVGAVCEGCDVGSGVNDQPCGLKETLTGARNRANRARISRPKAKIWIGIENGMLPIEEMGIECQGVKSGWVDVAAIVILTTDTEWILWSDAFPIPPEALEDCLDDDGHVVDVWSPLKDPHKHLTGGLRPRALFLEAPLRIWVQANLSQIALLFDPKQAKGTA